MTNRGRPGRPTDTDLSGDSDEPQYRAPHHRHDRRAAVRRDLGNAEAGPLARDRLRGRDLRQDALVAFAQRDAGRTLWVYSCSEVLTADTTNVVTATFTDSLGGTLVVTDTQYVDVAIAGLQIEKSVNDTIIYAGETVTYTYLVSNTGTSPDDAVQNVVVTDNKCAPVNYVSGDDGNNLLESVECRPPFFPEKL